MSPTANQCLGAPEGWTGGELEFCEAPTKPGRRFCDRCQPLREALYLQRVRNLEADLENAQEDLYSLLDEGQLQ